MGSEEAILFEIKFGGIDIRRESHSFERFPGRNTEFYNEEASCVVIFRWVFYRGCE